MFDLCYDFSFWQAETQRCIPKELYDEVTENGYTFPSICNRTNFDCMQSYVPYFTKYCPNKDKSCDQENHFFCNDSRTCIPKGGLYLPRSRIMVDKF